MVRRGSKIPFRVKYEDFKSDDIPWERRKRQLTPTFNASRFELFKSRYGKILKSEIRYQILPSNGTRSSKNGLTNLLKCNMLLNPY